MKCKKCDLEDPRKAATYGTAVQVLHCPGCGTPHRPDEEALRVCIVHSNALGDPRKPASSQPELMLFYSSCWEDALQAAVDHLPAGTRFHDVISTVGPLLVVPRKALQGFLQGRDAEVKVARKAG